VYSKPLHQAFERSALISARTAPAVDRTVASVPAVAIVVLLARMMLADLIIPPWQHPDEPIHVAAAEVWRSRITGSDAQDRGREADIIDSMIRHGWWRHYGQPLPPGPQPTRFVSTGAVFSTIGLVPESSSYAPPYYAAVGWLMSLAPRGAVERDLYFMRVVSMLCTVGTLWVAFLGSRLALDALGAATVTSLFALHPQVAIASTTAGPDAVVICAGAILWWQTMSALSASAEATADRRGTNQVRSLAILWLAAVGAAMVDRLGIALIPIAFIVTAVVAGERLRFRSAAAALGLVAVAIAVAAATIPAIRSPLRISLAETLVSSSLVDALHYTGRFTAFLLSSWWYSLGWVRYFAPNWWVVSTSVITAVAVAGTWRAFARSSDTRRVIILAVMNLLCFLAAVGWVFLRVQVGAQGRYLFPVIVPTLTLIWLGTAAWLPARFRHIGSAALIAAFAVLDLVVWSLVALPAYM
jgi:predicted membrane protein DUF2142